MTVFMKIFIKIIIQKCHTLLPCVLISRNFGLAKLSRSKPEWCEPQETNEQTSRMKENSYFDYNYAFLIR